MAKTETSKLTYIKLFQNYLDELCDLADGEFGKLVRAMLHFSITGEELPLPCHLRPVWKMLRGQILRDQIAYEATCQTNRENGKKGGRPPKEAAEPQPPEEEPEEETDRFFSKPKKPKNKKKEEDKEKDKEQEEDQEKEEASSVARPTLAEVVYLANGLHLLHVNPVEFLRSCEERHWLDDYGQPLNWKQELLRLSRRS